MHSSERPFLQSRWLFLDVAKGIAAVLMILGHAQIFFDPRCYFPPLPGRLFETVANPIQFWIYVFQSSVDAFYFCAGIMIGRKLVSAKEKGEAVARLPMLKRGLFLIAVDCTLISWSYWEAGTIFRPTIGSISCFGFCFIMVPVFYHFRMWGLVATALMLLLFREVFIFPYPYEQPIKEFIYGVMWAPVVTEAYDSLFVVICWLPIILLGMAFGMKMGSLSPGKLRNSFALGFALCAVVFCALRLTHSFGSLGQPVARSVVDVFQLTKYPASLQFHLVNMAFCFAYLWIGSFWERRRIFPKLQDAVTLLGRQIFFVYLFHLFVFGVLKHAAGLTAAKGSLLQSIFLFFGCLALSVVAARFYEQIKRRYRDTFFAFRYI